MVADDVVFGTQAIQEFSRKVQAEGINKRIHETRVRQPRKIIIIIIISPASLTHPARSQYHEKRKTRRRVNAHNSVYYAQRNKMVRRYARLIATTQKAQWGVDI